MAYPVAVIQFDLEPGEVESNRAALMVLGQEAVTSGAKLILFPEAAVSDLFRGAEALAESIPGPSTEMLQSIAGDATFALPLLEKAADGKVFSACALVDKSGVRGVARKTHFYRDSRGLDSYQDADILTPGSELSVIELDGVKVGVLLGYDSEFPEAYRTLALRGADLILVALNQLEPDYALLQSMAIRNRAPLLVANRLGFRRVYPQQPEYSSAALPLLQERGGGFLMRCKGHSGILNAHGKRLAQPAADIPERNDAPEGAPRIPAAHYQDDEVLTASFQLDELRVLRATAPFIGQRRKELYE